MDVQGDGMVGSIFGPTKYVTFVEKKTKKVVWWKKIEEFGNQTE